MNKGILITLEAGDGSGKATQTRLLAEHLQREGHRVHLVSFPDYAADASVPVRMYLRGDFGTHPGDVNAYAASTFFAVDRFASYRMKWQKYYEQGDIIIADRYTTSNMVHQAVKLPDAAERNAFLDWLWDFEFTKLGLPVPDLVLFLDMEPGAADKLIAARAEAAGTKKDIHERDPEYLHRCHAAYKELTDRYGWKRIICSRDGEPLPIDTIAERVYAAVEPVWKGKSID